jgi:hypothetical protein
LRAIFAEVGLIFYACVVSRGEKSGEVVWRRADA